MKKLFTILLLVLSLACIFCACDEGETPNQEEEPPHIHTWGEWRVTTVATCTAKGEKTRSCECGENESDEIAPIGHVIDSENVCMFCRKTTDQIRLSKMTRKVNNQYGELYFDESDGSIGYYNKMTEEIVFTNPESANGLETADHTANEMMSQVVAVWSEFNRVGEPVEGTFNSYLHSDTIVSCENVENGIRVSYHMPRFAFPHVIERSAFEEKILKPLREKATSREYAKFFSWYAKLFYKSYSDPEGGDYRPTYAGAIAEEYPIIAEKNVDVYILDQYISRKDLLEMADLMARYCPDYTEEELKKDHDFFEYDSCFKESYEEYDDVHAIITALTFVIDENGLTVNFADVYDTHDGQTLSLNGANYVVSDLQSYPEITFEILPYLRSKQHDCVTILCE